MSEVVKPPSRWLRTALVLSLALNLLLVGLAVGAAVNYRTSGGPPRNFDLSVGLLGRAMSPEDRQAVSEALREMPRGHTPGRRDMAALMGELTGVLRAEPFDAGAFTAMLDRQGQLWSDVQKTGQSVVVARIAAMTAEQRAAFADRIDAQLSRGPDGPRRN